MIYCGITNPIDLCGSCVRNIRNIELPTKEIYEMTIYFPTLMPKPACEGYKEDNECKEKR